MKGTVRKIQTPGGIRWAVSMSHNGKSIRERYRIKGEADARLSELRLQIGLGGYKLDALAMADLYGALAILPEGMSLTEAARLAAAQTAPAIGDATLPALAETFLDAKAAAGMATNSLANLSSVIKRASRGLPATTNSRTLTGRQLAEWVDSLNLTPTTRSNYKRALSNWMRWAIAQGYRTDDPAQAITIIKAPQKLPEVLTAPQIAAIMGAAVANLEEAKETVAAYTKKHPYRRHAVQGYVDGSGLIPYLALAAFAGVRPLELGRLDASHIAATEIHITPEIAKTKDARYIPIMPNLRAWLDAYPPSKSAIIPLSPSAFQRRMRHIREAAKVETWPHDVLRHSFGSYRLAYDDDINATLAAMGHSTQKILFTHYRRLVTKADSETYFNITPE